jgi:hypothetical protein
MNTTLLIVGIHLFEIIGIGIYFIIRKNKKLEKILIQQQEHIDTLNSLFEKLNTSFTKVNDKVWVEGDNELSEVFSDINEIKSAINDMYS